jgi:hypothetical protein
VQKDSVTVNFGRVFVTLQAKAPFEYRYNSSKQQGAGRGERRAAKLYSAIIRGGEKDKTQFIFVNPQTKQEISGIYPITADTLIWVPAWPRDKTHDSVKAEPERPEEIATYNLLFDSEPRGAGVKINGKDTGRITPFTLAMKGDDYFIEFIKAGFDTFFTSVRLSKNNDAIKGMLKAQVGWIKIVVNIDGEGFVSDAKVFIDGDLHGTTPKIEEKTIQLPVGEHLVKVEYAGHPTATQNIFVTKNETKTVTVTLRAK